MIETWLKRVLKFLLLFIIRQAGVLHFLICIVRQLTLRTISSIHFRRGKIPQCNTRMDRRVRNERFNAYVSRLARVKVTRREGTKRVKEIGRSRSFYVAGLTRVSAPLPTLSHPRAQGGSPYSSRWNTNWIFSKLATFLRRAKSNAATLSKLQKLRQFWYLDYDVIYSEIWEEIEFRARYCWIYRIKSINLEL